MNRESESICRAGKDKARVGDELLFPCKGLRAEVGLRTLYSHSHYEERGTLRSAPKLLFGPR